jgi:hypothetical protein
LPVYTFINELAFYLLGEFSNSSIHNINLRKKDHVHKSNANLSCFEQSTFYAANKIFDSFSPCLTIFKNEKTKFKASVRKYIHTPFIMGPGVA